MCEQSIRVENDQKINNRSVPNKENQGGKKCQKKKIGHGRLFERREYLPSAVHH